MPSVLSVRFGCAKRQRKNNTHTHIHGGAHTDRHTHSQIAAFRVVGCARRCTSFFGLFLLCGFFSSFVFSFAFFSARFSFTQHSRDSRRLVLVENNPQWVIAVLPTQPFPPVGFTFFNLLCVF